MTNIATDGPFLLIHRGGRILWNRLTPEQRTRAQTQGLAYKDLSPEFQTIVRENVKYRFNSMIRSNIGDNPWTPADLDTITVQIKITNRNAWGYRMQRGTRSQSGSGITVRTREEAYANYRKSAPDLRPDEI